MTPGGKFITLDNKLYDYLLAHGHNSDPLLHALVQETQEKLGRRAGMQIAPEQGTFMTLLARAIGARRAIEVGTFTGYSAICVARGLAEGGRLLCCDISEEWTSVAREYWKRAGLADRIELRLGPAARTLRELPEGTTFDYAFIDADKTSYVEYWNLIVPMIRPNGVILVDNTLSHGRGGDQGNTDQRGQAIRRFNDHARTDDRAELVLLPIGDGLTLARKR